MENKTAKIGIVISNYNRKEYVLNCIKSVFESSFTDFDIIFSDNASTDGSVEAVKQQYGEKVDIVTNDYNKGAAGGFNRGLQRVVEKGYQYFMLLDNDIILDPHAVEESLKFLEENKDVAIVGSKLYIMDRPNQIQELGADIDYDIFYVKPHYKNYIDDESIPEVVECDYVPSCSLMGRGELLPKVGPINEKYFIYWEDIDWVNSFKRIGFRVVSYDKSKVWHKMHAAVRVNTFATYYFWRNRIRFFAGRCSEEKIKQFCNTYLKELFQALYSCNYLGKKNVAKSLMYAYWDGMHGICYTAKEGRILPTDVIEDKLKNALNTRKNMIIFSNGYFKTLRNFVNKVKEINENCNITIIADEAHNFLKQFGQEGITVKDQACDISSFDAACHICNHIFDIKEPDSSIYYIDEFLNIIADDLDRQLCADYDNMYSFFYQTNYELMCEKVIALKEEL